MATDPLKLEQAKVKAEKLNDLLKSKHIQHLLHTALKAEATDIVTETVLGLSLVSERAIQQLMLVASKPLKKPYFQVEFVSLVWPSVDVQPSRTYLSFRFLKKKLEDDFGEPLPMDWPAIHYFKQYLEKYPTIPRDHIHVEAVYQAFGALEEERYDVVDMVIRDDLSVRFTFTNTVAHYRTIKVTYDPQVTLRDNQLVSPTTS